MRAAKVDQRHKEGSLDGLKRAPPPELLPALVLAAGAAIPVLGVRFYPQWPVYAHVGTFLAAALVFTWLARRVAKRRPPKWDPLLFFGVSAFAAAMSWSGDAGALWVVNSSAAEVTWEVDGGIEMRLEAGGRARLDLRRGPHELRSESQIVKFELERGERLALALGERACIRVDGESRPESMMRLSAARGQPEPCAPERGDLPPTTGDTEP